MFLKQVIKRITKKTPLYSLFLRWRAKRQSQKELLDWERMKKPVPPPHVAKQRVLRNYSKMYGLKIFVETGTFFGDMVEAMKEHFNRIYSIELGKALFEKASVRFKGVKNVQVIFGDSGVELRNLMKRIDQPALFWLDGHYSAGVTAKGGKETPIYEELDCILNAPDLGHVIIIDDARCFGTDSAYPSMPELEEFITSRRPYAEIAVEDDSIRITPKRFATTDCKKTGSIVPVIV
jgi:hypothetical protein